MSDTRYKFEEAQHFFEQMKKNIEDDKLFGFNLSAFLTAARSITFFMQNEFRSKTGFMNWYENKQKLMGRECSFKFVNEMRRATVHVKRVMSDKKVSVTISETPIQVADSVSVRVIRDGKIVEEHPSKDSKKTKTITSIKSLIQSASAPFQRSNNNREGRNVSRFFKEDPNEDPIRKCEKYIQKLRNIVDECEQLFNKCE
jgi:hypothetical protein